MKEFPIATDTQTYEIEGKGGLWLREKYKEAIINPESTRAMKGNSLAWFVPVPDNEQKTEEGERGIFPEV